MLNPEHRGEAFRWEEFVPFAVRWAKVSCWQSFTDAEWKRWENEIVEAAGKSAEYAAKRILQESGLLQWWPDPTKKPAPVSSELSEARLAALLDAERENTALRQQVAELHSHGVSLHKAAAAGRDMERAAVVAWLREQALQSHPDAAGWFALNHVSVMIERGEHRREEKE
jgi:hypothetical protein